MHADGGDVDTWAIPGFRKSHVSFDSMRATMMRWSTNFMRISDKRSSLIKYSALD